MDEQEWRREHGRGLLGMLLAMMDPSVFPDVRRWIAADDFEPRMGDVYSAMLREHDAGGDPTDPEALRRRLNDTRALDELVAWASQDWVTQAVRDGATDETYLFALRKRSWRAAIRDATPTEFRLEDSTVTSGEIMEYMRRRWTDYTLEMRLDGVRALIPRLRIAAEASSQLVEDRLETLSWTLGPTAAEWARDEFHRQQSAARDSLGSLDELLATINRAWSYVDAIEDGAAAVQAHADEADEGSWRVRFGGAVADELLSRLERRYRHEGFSRTASGETRDAALADAVSIGNHLVSESILVLRERFESAQEQVRQHGKAVAYLEKQLQ